jgi:hypothetical protein
MWSACSNQADTTGRNGHTEGYYVVENSHKFVLLTCWPFQCLLSRATAVRDRAALFLVIVTQDLKHSARALLHFPEFTHFHEHTVNMLQFADICFYFKTIKLSWVQNMDRNIARHTHIPPLYNSLWYDSFVQSELIPLSSVRKKLIVA